MSRAAVRSVTLAGLPRSFETANHHAARRPCRQSHPPQSPQGRLGLAAARYRSEARSIPSVCGTAISEPTGPEISSVSFDSSAAARAAVALGKGDSPLKGRPAVAPILG